MICCPVVFTIGPACQDVDTLCSILEAGATAARIDLTVSSLKSDVDHNSRNIVL